MNKEKIREQVLSIRDSGRTNMFDTNMVQRLAILSLLRQVISHIKTKEVLKNEYC